MHPWNPEAMSFDEYTENVLEQVDRRKAGLSWCEDPNNPSCACSACEEAEEKGNQDFLIFLVDNPELRAIIEAEQEGE